MRRFFGKLYVQVLVAVRMENTKEPGRVGVRALVCFETLSTVALVLGLVVVNVVRPAARAARTHGSPAS